MSNNFLHMFDAFNYKPHKFHKKDTHVVTSHFQQVAQDKSYTCSILIWNISCAGMVGISVAWQSDVINCWPFLVHISALVILQKEFFSLLLDWFDCQVFMYPPLYYGCCTHTDWVWMSIWEPSVLAFIKVSLRRSIQPARPVDQTLNHLRHTQLAFRPTAKFVPPPLFRH